LAVMVLLALLAPVVAPFDVQETHPHDRLQSPNSTYVMGTDKFGRDVFSRVLGGARTDLTIATFGVVLGIALGLVVGLVTGYSAGGPVDHLLQRLIDIEMTVPPLLLAIAIITGVGKGSF